MNLKLRIGYRSISVAWMRWEKGVENADSHFRNQELELQGINRTTEVLRELREEGNACKIMVSGSADIFLSMPSLSHARNFSLGFPVAARAVM